MSDSWTVVCKNLSREPTTLTLRADHVPSLHQVFESESSVLFLSIFDCFPCCDSHVEGVRVNSECDKNKRGRFRVLGCDRPPGPICHRPYVYSCCAKAVTRGRVTELVNRLRTRKSTLALQLESEENSRIKSPKRISSLSIGRMKLDAEFTDELPRLR